MRIVFGSPQAVAVLERDKWLNQTGESRYWVNGTLTNPNPDGDSEQDAHFDIDVIVSALDEDAALDLAVADEIGRDRRFTDEWNGRVIVL